MSKKLFRISAITIFIIYCAVMIWLLFFKDRIGIPVHSYWETLKSRINLIPFKTVIRHIYSMAASSNFTHSFVNFFGNIFVFVPLGVFLPYLLQKTRTFLRCLVYSGTAIIIVELTQLFTLRGFLDIDDLLLNLLGISMGFALYKLFSHFTKGILKK